MFKWLWDFFRTSKEEREIIEALKNKDNGTQSMRVEGRGTLVMDASDVTRSVNKTLR